MKKPIMKSSSSGVVNLPQLLKIYSWSALFPLNMANILKHFQNQQQRRQINMFCALNVNVKEIKTMSQISKLPSEQYQIQI